MSEELSNPAKLAIQKYLVAIFLGGFTILSTVAYFAFIKPLENRVENLEPKIMNAVNMKVDKTLDKVNDRAEKSFIKNQNKFYEINTEAMTTLFKIQSKSKEMDEKIEEAKQKINKLNSVLEEATLMQNSIIKIRKEIERNSEVVKNVVLEARTDAAAQAQQNLTSMLAKIEKLSAEIKLVSSKVESAHPTEVVRSDVPDEAKGVTDEGRPKSDGPIELLPCDPLDLTEQQMELISIEQRAEKTNTLSSNKKRYYRNTFSVAIRRDGGATVPRTVRECILDAIVRVDYILSEYWFKPARNPGRDADFHYSIRVWGVTPVIAEVHLKGDKPTLKKHGWFSVSDGEVTYFESGSG